MHYIALTGGGMLAVGCLLPWLSLGAGFVGGGLEALLGALALLSGIFAAGLAAFNIARNENRMRCAYLATGALSSAIGIIGLLNGDRHAIVSTGLWFVTAGGLLLAGTGLVNLLGDRFFSSVAGVASPHGPEAARVPVPTALFGVAGPYAGSSIPLVQEGIVMGRDPAACNLVIPAPQVSRRHARIVPSALPGFWTIEDLGSTNGTYVRASGEWVRVSGPMNISLFGRFCLGDEGTEFEVR